jgi:SAM-dependent methyltransferase
MAAAGGWSRYYDAAGDEPRETLLEALRRFDEEGYRRGSAVDLGCGTGRDTAELLHRGWTVLAIDMEPEAIDRLRNRVDLDAGARQRLQTQVASFDEADWRDADLVNSSFALPFCSPDAFAGLWSRLVASLRPGGRFSGQLFGERDGWSSEKGMTFLTRAQLEGLFAPLEVEMLDEVEQDGTTARGATKHWHLFHIVARKPG